MRFPAVTASYRLRLKSFDLECFDSGKMLGVTGKQGQVVFQRRGSDQGISQLPAISERMRINERHRPCRDCRCQRKNMCLLNGEPTFDALQFFLAAATLREFEVGNR